MFSFLRKPDPIVNTPPTPAPTQYNREIIVSRQTSVVYPQIDYLNNVRLGYQKNSTVQVCMNYLISSFIDSCPPEFYRNGKLIATHPLNQLARKPNEFQTASQFWSDGLLHYFMSGNAFCRIIRSAAGVPVSMYFLRPDRVQIIPDPDNFISHYVYLIDGYQHIVRKEDIVHLRCVSGDNDYFGIAPITGVIPAISVQNELMNTLKYYLNNRCTPGLAIEVPEGVLIDEATKDTIKIKFKAVTSGSTSGDPIVLTEGTKVTSIPVPTIKEMIPVEVNRMLEAQICGCFGISPILLGLPAGLGTSTYNNYEQAKTAFATDTLKPLFTLFGQIYDPFLRESETCEFQLEENSSLKDEGITAQKSASTSTSSKADDNKNESMSDGE